MAIKSSGAEKATHAEKIALWNYNNKANTDINNLTTTGKNAITALAPIQVASALPAASATYVEKVYLLSQTERTAQPDSFVLELNDSYSTYSGTYLYDSTSTKFVSGTNYIQWNGSSAYELKDSSDTTIGTIATTSQYDTEEVSGKVMNGTTELGAYTFFPEHDAIGKIKGHFYECVNNSGTYSWVDAQVGVNAIGPCTNIRCLTQSTTVRIKWSDPEDTSTSQGAVLAKWDNTVLVRKVGGYPTSVSDGTVIMTSTVRDQYKTSAYIDTLPDASVTYYYKLFPCTTTGLYNEDNSNQFRTGELSWASIQDAVRSGDGASYFSVGDVITATHSTYGTIEFQVMGHDLVTPADSTKTHSMTLLPVKVLTALQFDAPEKAYALTEDENFNLGLEIVVTGNSSVNGTYKLFDTSLTGNNRIWRRVNGTYDIRFTGGFWVIFNYNSSSVAVTQTTTSTDPYGSEGVWGSSVVLTKSKKYYTTDDNITYVEATVTDGDPVTANTYYEKNDTNRVNYGSNNWKESALRQWLNSSNASGSWWSQQTIFGNAPSYATQIAGFLAGFGSDFLSAIGKAKIKTARNTTNEGGGFDETEDFFYLASQYSIFGGTSQEDSIYPYYRDIATTQAQKIKYNSSGQASFWWLRSCYPGNSSGVYTVYSSGALYGNFAYGSLGVSPAVNII